MSRLLDGNTSPVHASFPFCPVLQCLEAQVNHDKLALCDTEYWMTSLYTSYIVLFSTGRIFIDFCICLSHVLLAFYILIWSRDSCGQAVLSSHCGGHTQSSDWPSSAWLLPSLTDGWLAFYLVYVWCGEERTTLGSSEN